MYGAAERIHCTNARAVAELAAGSMRGVRDIETVIGRKAGAIITSVSAWAREAAADVRSRRVIAYNYTSLVRLLPAESGSFALARLPHGVASSRESQSGTARCSDPAARVGTYPRRRRQRQDARSDDADRMVARDRAGEPAVGAGGDFHQQGGQGDEHPALGADTDEHPRHVDWHLSRTVQPTAARALPRGGAAEAVSDHGYAGPAGAHQTGVQGAQHRRRTLPGAAAASAHQRVQGGRLASEPGRGVRRA